MKLNKKMDTSSFSPIYCVEDDAGNIIIELRHTIISTALEYVKMGAISNEDKMWKIIKEDNNPQKIEAIDKAIDLIRFDISS